ncbi:MAG TPA: DNA polymerase III subunit delta [Candidatus Paceibacterota bacterium]|nr:DNA polymerase III subunit delta [Candidatus Paceibacterota bacterium]
MIIVYHGTDGGRLHLAVRHLTARFGEKHPGSAGPARLDLEQAGHGDALEQALRNRSFFNEPSLVIVRNAFAGDASAELAHRLLEDGNTARAGDTVLVIREDRSEKDLAKASRKLWKLLNGQAKQTRSFEPLTGAKLTAWMKEYCAERGCTLDAAACALLQAGAGTDSWNLVHEMDKLCAWKGSGTLGADAVRAVGVPVRQEAHIFALTDALAGRDKRGSLRELERHRAQGADPHYLLSMYAFAVRNLLAVKDLSERGLAPAAIASRAKLHPFVVKKTLGASRRFTPAELAGIHGWLVHADRATKRGVRDAGDALYDFVLSVL